MSHVISNASPLIALRQIGQLDLLEELFEMVVIPQAVAEEIRPSIEALPGWVEVRKLSQEIGARILSYSLGPGESEALSLALETRPDRVILDERRARRLARSLGLPVVGTLGILVAAKTNGLISAVKPHLDELSKHDFFVAPELYDRVIDEAGEGAEEAST